MDTYSIIALIFVALLLVSVLVATRRYNRKLQEELLARDTEEDNFQQIELSRVQNPSQQDLHAYRVIEAECQKVYKKISIQTSFAPKKVWEKCFDLIKQIAAIYHPDTENPQKQASVVDLLELTSRAIERVQEYLEMPPLNTIRDINIQDLLRYKGYYAKATRSTFAAFVKNHGYLYSIGKYAWMGFRAMRPWYWVRKVAFIAGKEASFRYLLRIILTAVGEEAVLVYSKRRVRKEAVVVEKDIAFEMINMAIVDNAVSSEEYDIILRFILNNRILDDQLKVTLLKALHRKQRVKTAAISGEVFLEKVRKRLLTQVELVAKADTLGRQKKCEALKELEKSIQLPSSYRTKMEATPEKDMNVADVMQQNRKREESILRLIVQAGSIAGDLPEVSRKYIVQRASNYVDPFSEQEQDAILQEASTPTIPADTLTKAITSDPDRKRALSEVLEALLNYLPFSREKETFYLGVVTALGLKDIGQKLLCKRLEGLLPSYKLLNKPPFEVLKAFLRLICQDEEIIALQETATTHQFDMGEEKPRKQSAPYWLCVTTSRILVLAAVKGKKANYEHHLEFKKDLDVRLEKGGLHDTFILKDQAHVISLRNSLFHSSNLRNALNIT